MRFKERSHFHYVKVQGEATSADIRVTVSYPEDLSKTINEGTYTKQRMFNVVETVRRRELY